MVTIPLSSEFLVNTTTTNTQSQPEIAMNRDGSYVVTWQSFPQDNSDFGIYAQRFDADGLPVGGEFQVNTFTSLKQTNADVAIDDSGNFVVVWESDRQDGSSFGIFAKRFNSSGQTLSGDVRVNTFVTGNQLNPDVAMDADGNYVVVWESISQPINGATNFSRDVFAQRFDENGNPQGQEILINSFTAGDQEDPEVAMDADGNFVVTWESFGQDGSAEGVYARVFDQDGDGQGNDFRVNTFTTNDQLNPSVAINDDGEFVIAWQSSRQDGPLDVGGIYAQQFSSNGTPVGGEIHVNALFTPSAQQNPRVAIAGDGGFTVTWNGEGNGDSNGVFGQQFDANGERIGQDFLINTTTVLGQEEQAIAMMPDGDFTVIWKDGGASLDKNSSGIIGRRFGQGEIDIVGNNGNNTLNGNALDNLIDGKEGDDRLFGVEGNDTMIGGLGQDQLDGGLGNDQLTGVEPSAQKPGVGELDDLTGGSGRDIFVLGDRQEAYYNDGKAKKPGTSDFALITDFKAKQDTIQLFGDAEEYRLGASPQGTSEGVAIFLETGKKDELVAVIEDVKRLNFNQGFSFV